jgi:hypothetical protein
VLQRMPGSHDSRVEVNGLLTVRGRGPTPRPTSVLTNHVRKACVVGSTETSTRGPWSSVYLDL